MRRRKTVICREGWYYLLVLSVVAVGSVLRNVNMLLVVSTIMLFGMLFSCRMAINAVRGVTLCRKFPATMRSGETLDIQLILRSAKTRNLLAEVGSRCLEIDETIRHLLPKRQLVKKTVPLMCWYLPRGGEETLIYRARLLERGLYRIGPTRISTAFPLGLIRHTRIFDQGDRFLVFPHTGRLLPAFGRMFAKLQQGMRGDPLRKDRQTGDFHGLRDWREGDSRRVIHWRSTARRGIPLVREFEHQQHQELNLLVDLGREQDYEDSSRVEQVIRFAATIVSEFCRHRDGTLQLVIVGAEITSGGGANQPRVLEQLLTMLATADTQRLGKKAEATEQAFVQGIQLLSRSEDRDRPTLVLSPHGREPATVAAIRDASAEKSIAGGTIQCINTNSDMLEQFFDPAD